MRRIAIAAMSTISGVVLLFSYHTSTGSDEEATAFDTGGTTDAGETTESLTPTEPPGDTGSPSPSASAGTSGTFKGDTVQTQWGPVQVQITVKDGKITKVKTLQHPNANEHDQKLNAWALPQLEKATLESNGQQIDTIAGATVTTNGYRQSLQSAMDKANL